MTDPLPHVETAIHTRYSGLRLGFWAALFTAIAALAALGIAVTTAPARSGPFCLVESCITYPYTDAAAFVPIDYIWMIPAFLLSSLFMVLVACMYDNAPTDKKLLGLVALSFAIISAAALTINYFIQLTVMQPSFLKGEIEGLSLFSQYNPHGVFIALEDVGYLMMGVAFLFVAFLFDRRQGLGQAIRLILIGSSLMAIGSLILLALLYGHDLEYRYEVAVLLIDWVTLIILGPLIGIFFRREAAR